MANPSIPSMKEGSQRHERKLLAIVMETKEKKHRDYWYDQVFFTGGYGYGTHLVEIAIDSEGKRRYEARTINLGKEEDIPSLTEKHDLHGCFIAVGDNWKRHLVKKKVSKIAPNLNYVSSMHPCAQVARNVKIGIGTVVMGGAIINGDSTVGQFCIINSNASLDHDCIMEDFSSLAPNATVGGSVRIGGFSAVSLGANVIHGRRIGKHTVVGAGSLVIHDMPDFSVALGSPAEVVRERKEGDEYL